MSDPINVLWSGGFDSTYLLMKRLEQRRHVKPIVYVSDPTWQKHLRELAAREHIRKLLPWSFRRRLASDMLILSEDHVEALRRQHDKMCQLGFSHSGQDEMLCTIAEMVGPVECGTVAVDRHELGSPELASYQREVGLFDPIAHKTKTAIWQEAQGTILQNALEATWSCEWANIDIDGLWACGQCYPCQVRLIHQEALDWD